MACTATVTGKVGPAQTVTAQVFTNVGAWHQDCSSNILTLYQTDPNRVIQIDITAATTYTVTKSGSTYTVAIS